MNNPTAQVTPLTITVDTTATPLSPRLPLELRNAKLRFESDNGEQGCVAFAINYEEIYNLKGRLLTLIDATFTDPQQRKAQKDVVWQAVQHWMNDIERSAGYDPLPITRYGEGPPQV